MDRLTDILPTGVPVRPAPGDAGDCLSCRALERQNRDLTDALRLLITMDYLKPQGREIITKLLAELDTDAVPSSPTSRAGGSPARAGEPPALLGSPGVGAVGGEG